MKFFLISFIFAFLFFSIYSQVIHVTQTAKNTDDRLTPKPDIYFQDKKINENEIIIDQNQIYQTIYGFGGAFTEACAVNWIKLNSTLRHQILYEYFHNLHYRVGRVHINSCDFCESSYSFDNIPNDYELKNFSLRNGHDLYTVIPLIKQALEIVDDEFRLFGSPWSPPFWMKQNQNMNTSTTPGLINSPQIHQSWALYFSKWISAYEEQGIPIWGITIQNEPANDALWESCCYTVDEEADFLANYLGPQLKKDHPDVKIMMYDYNKDHVYDWAQGILGNRPDASKYVDGVAFHWYSGSEFGNVEKIHDEFPGYFLLATEACVCPYTFAYDWATGESYAFDILGDLNSWAVGWVDWNLCLDTHGGPNHLNNFCGSPIMIDPDTHQIIYQPAFYYMGQISKFVLPGSRRIYSYVLNQNIDIVSSAFISPTGDIVLVVLNQSYEEQSFDIVFNQRYANVTLPENSIATFVFEN
ncbi:glucosylceramidase [Anaeramoeba ignava]|uniref:Glucosylceramidase n=1 Tax=Anaeramoeba ignava TaxID=1746090 RepID=A0A9Q0LNK3_ANAIG|nr:glucosylceramidase [Anaeramoeba ignava]